ncbi:hypothetical protein [Chitinimonas sp. BJB300]|uniref:hypothetical protein n=1 Tax=Chitinimonas sp. BJB300 TaxID=1559339 RepID=UPI000C11D282|nr:hypothetical protein [Chitinimonas sp. BJB300]PHV11376.1 hypothetical protein CSQ89_11165 [Chitinimonas sp. BJB300]TSJ88905.1 hypothetical protein FG002_008405 [Chitinimonas sp. BJB300]
MKFRCTLTIFFLLATPAADALDSIHDSVEALREMVDSTLPVGPFASPPYLADSSFNSTDLMPCLEAKAGLKPIFETSSPTPTAHSQWHSDMKRDIESVSTDKEREVDPDFSQGYFVATQKLLSSKVTSHTQALPQKTTSEPVTKASLATAEPTPTLVDNLVKLSNQAEFEVTEILVTSEVYAAGIRNGEMRLLKVINDILGRHRLQ